MRVIKLSSEEPGFETFKKVRKFFREVIPKRLIPGQFRFKKRRIASNGLSPNELLVFTYKAGIKYIGRTLTGRMDSNDIEDPHCFQIDLKTLVEGNGSNLKNLEKRFKESGIDKNLTGSRGWVIVPESVYGLTKIAKILNEFKKK